jgi:hypothetical protein
VTEEQNAAKDERARLQEVLGAHGLWIPRLLFVARAWEYVLPWPLGYVDYLFQYSRSGPKRRRIDDSAWVTFVLVVWCYAAYVAKATPGHFEKSYAPDVSKILFSGAFLIGTILSVSVALPGQSLAKLALGRRPMFAVEFVLPMFWGFLSGIFGALLMLFFSGLPHLVPGMSEYWGRIVQGFATIIALYGAVMELNAIIHTVRMYLIGMLLWSKELHDKAETPARSIGAPQEGTPRLLEGAIGRNDASKALKEPTGAGRFADRFGVSNKPH